MSRMELVILFLFLTSRGGWKYEMVKRLKVIQVLPDFVLNLTVRQKGHKLQVRTGNFATFVFPGKTLLGKEIETKIKMSS